MKGDRDCGGGQQSSIRGFSSPGRKVNRMPNAGFGGADPIGPSLYLWQWIEHSLLGYAGSGSAHPASEARDRLRGNPDPVPWSVAFLVSKVISKEAASNMTNKAAAQQIIANADEAITEFIDSDDICPRWPYPGPSPWLSIIASVLTFVANNLQEGNLRTGILQVAGQVLDRAQALGMGTAAAELIAGRESAA